MTEPKLITFDVYMALLDIQGSLTPVIEQALDLDKANASGFVSLWRAKQMERAASSNSLEMAHTPFRVCTALAFDYTVRNFEVRMQRSFNVTTTTRDMCIMAWDSMTPWPEADDVIGQLRRRGIPVAILSNGDQDMLDAVAGGFSAGFDHVLSAESAGRYKPHASVYALPERTLGIAHGDVLHVAGSGNDVLGAVATGMRCAWSNRQHEAVLDPAWPPEAIFSDLRGVLDYITDV